jgi:hypothetical protein
MLFNGFRLEGREKMNVQLPPSLDAAIKEQAEEKSTYPRENHQFEDAEIKEITKHKADYITIRTREEREVFFKTKILVTIFEYWYKIKEVKEDISDDELSFRIKVRLIHMLRPRLIKKL